MLPDTIFKNLESLSVTTNINEGEVYPSDFVAKQPSLLEFKNSTFNRRLNEPCPTLKGLCIGYVDQLLADSITTEKLRSLSILRVGVDIPIKEWEVIARKLPRLRCIELTMFLRHRTDGSDGKACRILSLFGKGIATEFGVLINVKCNDDVLKNSCTSTKRLVGDFAEHF